MRFTTYIKNLEKRKIVSREPSPIIPFILTFISLFLGIIVFQIDINKFWSYVFFLLAGFAFIFAILHWIVVRIVEKK